MVLYKCIIIIIIVIIIIITTALLSPDMERSPTREDYKE